jgi:DNA-binding NtrC family response regulator
VGDPEQLIVLVVDDELGPRESLRAILQSHYRVLVAMDGEQAVRIVEQEPVDIVLLDLRMPGLSGRQVMEKIKAINPALAVIVVTGSDPYGLVPTESRLLVFDYIVKPFHIAHVRETVKRAVAHRSQ